MSDTEVDREEDNTAGGGHQGNSPSPRRDAPPPPPAPFTHPTEASFLSRRPRYRDENPHRKAAAYDPTPAGPEDMLVQVTFQRGMGNFDLPVIDGELAVANVDQGLVKTLNKHRDRFALIAPFLGGAHFLAVYKTDNLIADITNILVDGGLAAKDDFEIIPLTPKKDTEHTPSYAPPFTLAIQFQDPEARERMITAAMFPATVDHTFHIFEYNLELRTWTLGLWTVTTGGGRPENGARLRWTLTCLILKDPKIGKAFEHATSEGDIHPILVHLLDFARTIDTCWNPHSKQWAAYVKPCTNNSAGWEAVWIADKHGKSPILPQYKYDLLSVASSLVNLNLTTLTSAGLTNQREHILCRNPSST
ncbi:hypothetical protein DFH07DRAFT_767474 [Mycena maculata]|uniref:Uncharacterized protein n=1 Tax=Mycena maculata TaxID=230809 RepID=A0AAD7NTL8_9AGAR|nr:hypothetical protein DFH07DRAFT_767474 [Mycena maculata]